MSFDILSKVRRSKKVNPYNIVKISSNLSDYIKEEPQKQLSCNNYINHSNKNDEKAILCYTKDSHGKSHKNDNDCESKQQQLVIKDNKSHMTNHTHILPKMNCFIVQNKTPRSSLSFKNKSETVNKSQNYTEHTNKLANKSFDSYLAENTKNKNYLSGTLTVNSMLGAVELDKMIPSREIKIFIGTWNMNGQNPPKQINDFLLPSDIDSISDVVVVGTQESCSIYFEWEVKIQETLGPTHILLHSANLGTLHLALFIRRDLIWFCSEPENDSLSVRPGTAFRTKGAVAISFCLFGTSMLFITSHLTAHTEKLKERVHDIRKIIHSLDLPKKCYIKNKSKDVTQNFDSIYWCGDLNFRLGESREKIVNWIEETTFPLSANLSNNHICTDQLTSVLANGVTFKDFHEAVITFPPTYKYDPGTQLYDTSLKQRAPAYTDRILYKCKSYSSIHGRSILLASNRIDCLAYNSVPSIISSDHKPVWALFSNSIRPGIDSIPLAAGFFNRAVYLEGMKRRLNIAHITSSSVCCIQ